MVKHQFLFNPRPGEIAKLKRGKMYCILAGYCFLYRKCPSYATPFGTSEWEELSEIIDVGHDEPGILLDVFPYGTNQNGQPSCLPTDPHVCIIQCPFTKRIYGRMSWGVKPLSRGTYGSAP